MRRPVVVSFLAGAAAILAGWIATSCGKAEQWQPQVPPVANGANAQGIRWVAAGGVAGKLFVCSPFDSSTPGAIRSLALTIDCFVERITEHHGSIVIATMALSAEPNPGGLYRVDLTDGSCSLLATNEQIGGRAKLLASRCGDSLCGILATTPSGVFQIELDGTVTRLAEIRGDIIGCTMVGETSLVYQARDGSVVLVDLVTGESRETSDPGYRFVPSQSGDPIAVRTGSIVQLDHEVTRAIGAVSPAIGGAITFAFRTRTSHEPVVVCGDDALGASTWNVAGYHLTSRRVAIFDAVEIVVDLNGEGN